MTKLVKFPFPWAETSGTAIPCKGYRHNTPDNSDYDCAYEHAPECERCLCAGGTINPKTGKAATPAQRLASLTEILAKRDDQLRKAEEDLRQATEQARADRAALHELMHLLMVARALLEPLRRIGQAYHDNALDDEARKYWGPDNDPHENTTDPKNIVLYSGRGGKELLTLDDCLAALGATKSIEKKTGELVLVGEPHEVRTPSCTKEKCPSCPMVNRGCPGVKP